MKKRHYRKGDYLFSCDRCGTTHYASQGQMEWDNFFVCKECFEERQPQDFVRGRVDEMRVPIARPRPTRVDRS